jgi:hypothetical protein
MVGLAMVAAVAMVAGAQQVLEEFAAGAKALAQTVLVAGSIQRWVSYWTVEAVPKQMGLVVVAVIEACQLLAEGDCLQLVWWMTAQEGAAATADRGVVGQLEVLVPVLLLVVVVKMPLAPLPAEKGAATLARPRVGSWGLQQPKACWTR